MQKNLYFQSTLKRHNIFKAAFLDFMLVVASYPRLLLEVFIRKNFGQRYFAWASVISIGFILIICPMIGNAISTSTSGGTKPSDGFWSRYCTWYLFLAAFLYFAWLRSREVKSVSSFFDFSRFSLYSGDIHRFFINFKIAGKRQTVRIIEILLEPGAFFLVGILLLLIGQSIGYLLVLSALAYSFSYSASYRQGDNFILDKIDQIIMNEELNNAFVEDLDGDKTRGVRFHMNKPSSKTLREKLAASFLGDDNSDGKDSVAIVD